MFFKANEKIELDMSRENAISLFEKSFYDMHKAGYTLSTRIIHSDYNGKKFTGYIDENGTYIARYCGYIENERYYRSAPISKVSFDGDEKSTTVNIKMKLNYNAFFFIIAAIMLIAAIVLLIIEFNTSLKIPFIIISVIAFLMNCFCLWLGKKNIDDALSEFYYIFKYKDK